MEYNLNFNDQSVVISSDQLKHLAKSFLISSSLLKRISEYLLLETYIYNVMLGVNPDEIFTAIKSLDDGVVTGVKPASQFRNLPLMGLWHQHFFSAQFIINNISLGLGKDGTGNLIDEILTNSRSPVITKEMIK